ncbi:MAG: 3-phosphoshikimate 1-carboxyvinyltransferase [Flavobacteriales bacterium]
MIAALSQGGVSVDSKNGMLPLHIQGPLKGGSISIDASLSSQFLTGLLIALSRAPEPSVIDVKELNSIPYIDLTIQVLGQFGVEIKHDEYKRFYITPKSWKGKELTVQGDWSGGAFLLVAGALCAERGLTVANLNADSAQADRAILDVLKMVGVRFEIQPDAVQVWQSEIHAFEFDATHCPDLFPPLTALAAFADGVSIIRGVSRLTHKESNRAKTLQQEFAKAGIRIVVRDDEMKIYPAALRRSHMQSHGDHRIAMAAAIVGMAGAHTTILQSHAIAKSFPSFFALLQGAGARISSATMVG